MKLVGYIRVSKESQRKSGLGLGAQDKMLRDFAAAHYPGVALAIKSDDEAKSGALPVEERNGLLEAIDSLCPGDILLVPKRDRLARDIGAIVAVEKMVESRGARIVSTRGEGTEDDEPESIMMRMVFDAFAVYERLITRKRTRLALGEKKSRGEKVGAPPYGWKMVRHPTDEKKMVMVESEQEQGVIGLIRGWRQRGMGTRGIATALNEKGVPPKRKGSEKWYASAVRSILEAEKRRKSFGSK